MENQSLMFHKEGETRRGVPFGLQLDSSSSISASGGNGKCLKPFGGPGEIRTHDLFHAMEARSQLRHRPNPTRRFQ